MDIFIIYIIKTLLLPLSSLLLISLTGLFLLKQRNYAVAIISLSLVSLFLLSLPIVTKLLTTTQEKYPPVKLTSVDDFSAQAIVVLGGGLRGVAPEYENHITLSHNTLERIRYAALLAKQTKLPLLVSGGKVLDTNIPSIAEIMADVLNNEFNQAVRWQEKESRNTAENAKYSQQMLSQDGIKRIILVTHALHMYRSVQQFRNQGLQVLPAPTVFISKQRINFPLSFLPSAGALKNSSLAIHEIMGRAWYELRY